MSPPSLTRPRSYFQVLTTRESALDAPQLATLRESDLQQFERTEDVQMYEEQEASAAAEAAVRRNKKRSNETKTRNEETKDRSLSLFSPHSSPTLRNDGESEERGL